MTDHPASPGSRLDPAVLANDPARRTVLLRLLQAAVDEVDPDRAVRRAMQRTRNQLRVGDTVLDLDDIGLVRLLAFGKAAPAMARATVEILDGFFVPGLVISNHSEPLPDALESVIGGHPVPNDQSAQGARSALQLVTNAGEKDLTICLISGGGSALLESPAAGLQLEDLQSTVTALLESGAPIEEINIVRKHLSAIKGGRLAQAAAPAQLITLILSDVVGSPLDAIASGPTVPDPSTFRDALTVLDDYSLRERVPPAVVAHLERGASGEIPDTPKAPYDRQTVVVVGDGAMAARGAASAAEREGISVRTATTTMTGEAREVAVSCLSKAGPGLTLFAGETTVTVTGGGHGGRNQEAGLAAAIELDGDPSTVFAALGTDGIDGTTDAAGALVDGRTVQRAQQQGMEPAAYLAANNAHPLLAATGDLLISGPTGTNVGDVWIVWRM